MTGLSLFLGLIFPIPVFVMTQSRMLQSIAQPWWADHTSLVIDMAATRMSNFRFSSTSDMYASITLTPTVMRGIG